MKIRAAPWSAAAKLPPFGRDSKAAASLPHSKALRAFSGQHGISGAKSEANYCGDSSLRSA